MDIRNGHIYSTEQVAAMPPGQRQFVREMQVDPTAEQLARGAVGRNDPCPCGSTKKFKRCCLVRMQGPRRDPEAEKVYAERIGESEKDPDPDLDPEQLHAAIRDLIRRRWAETPPGERCFDRDEAGMERLYRFLDGGPDPASSAEARSHLLECSRCRFVYACARETMLATKGVASQSRPR